MADKRTGICFRALADLGGLYAEQSLPPRRKSAQHRRNCCRLGERPEMGDLEPPEEAPSALQAEFFAWLIRSDRRDKSWSASCSSLSQAFFALAVGAQVPAITMNQAVFSQKHL